MNATFLKILNLVTVIMSVVDQIKGAGNGQKKADLVIELTPALISAVEATIDKDLLNQAKVQEAERAFFTATINFAKAIDAAKHAKGTGGTPQ